MASRTVTSSLVYSTDGGRMCPACRHPMAACQCAAPKAIPPVPGKVRVTLETKGRGGKSVTVVRSLPLEADALALAARHERIGNLIVRAHLSGAELTRAILASDLIVSRSGYTTLMDLVAIGRSRSPGRQRREASDAEQRATLV